MVRRLTDVTVLVSSHDAEWMDAVDTIIDLRR
jgi:excinuclease UvrABC ATPase subunit